MPGVIYYHAEEGDDMQVSTKFTVAVHILTYVAYVKDSSKNTSEAIASSVGTNPVIIRNSMSALKRAGLIDVKRGPGGIVLKHPLSEITLLDVYRAVETKADDTLFRFHEHPNPECPVGKHIHDGLDDVLNSIQNHFEADLASHTLEEIYQNSTLPKTVSN
ncbi:Rrf2 family transcriptional regulator [Sharpea azabuensis]|uniref:Rrf2 family transcriptional regulator n=1 Tax=Sharpea azabuensis TaxID=322505 RepID=UPI0024094BE4|nr:Rrf2 family transcriptional regulator [Sharpea azabuensis]